MLVYIGFRPKGKYDPPEPAPDPWIPTPTPQPEPEPEPEPQPPTPDPGEDPGSGEDPKPDPPTEDPTILRYVDDDPYVGEVKMLTDLGRRTVDIRSEDFDGWVYADGSSYSQSDFPTAYVRFRGSNGRFSVPRLEQFFRGTTNSGDVFSNKVFYSNPLAKHSHTMHVGFEKQVV